MLRMTILSRLPLFLFFSWTLLALEVNGAGNQDLPSQQDAIAGLRSLSAQPHGHPPAESQSHKRDRSTFEADKEADREKENKIAISKAKAKDGQTSAKRQKVSHPSSGQPARAEKDEKEKRASSDSSDSASASSGSSSDDESDTESDSDKPSAGKKSVALPPAPGMPEVEHILDQVLRCAQLNPHDVYERLSAIARQFESQKDLVGACRILQFYLQEHTNLHARDEKELKDVTMTQRLTLADISSDRPQYAAWERFLLILCTFHDSRASNRLETLFGIKLVGSDNHRHLQLEFFGRFFGFQLMFDTGAFNQYDQK